MEPILGILQYKEGEKNSFHWNILFEYNMLKYNVVKPIEIVRAEAVGINFRLGSATAAGSTSALRSPLFNKSSPVPLTWMFRVGWSPVNNPSCMTLAVQKGR